MKTHAEFELVASAARKWRLMRMFDGSVITVEMSRPEADAVQLILDLAIAEAELRTDGLDGDGGSMALVHPTETVEFRRDWPVPVAPDLIGRHLWLRDAWAWLALVWILAMALLLSRLILEAFLHIFRLLGLI